MFKVVVLATAYTCALVVAYALHFLRIRPMQY